MNYDYSVYLVTDQRCMSTNTLCEAVEQAIIGGCTMIQLREKELDSFNFYCLAKNIKRVTDKYDIPLIINDRLDIALSINAAGVHIGQNDIPAAAVRKIIGKDMLLGVSASTLHEALQAQQDGADYLGVGAMRPTKTKHDAKMVSVSELKRICQTVQIPVVAIGGINQDNAAGFLLTGIDGIAVISAIIAQPDIRQAAAELKRITIAESNLDTSK